MCGIAGVVILPTEKKISYRHKKIKQVFNEIFAETEDRGKHATGVTITGYRENGDPFFAVLKGPYKAEEFMYTEGEENESGMTYPKVLRRWDKLGDNVKAVIGHCRFKTQGDEHENLNNHPIVVPLKQPEIVGVHNGSLDNDHLIFQELKLKRDGEVDSEAIFKIMQHLGLGQKRVALDDLVETAKYLDGKYAVVGYNTLNPDLIFTFRDSRPLEFAVCEDLDAIFIASETKFITAAFARFNRSALSYGWTTIKHETFTHYDNHSYIIDASKELKVGTGGTISKYECVEDKTLTREIYEGFKSKTSTTTSYGYNRGMYQSSYQHGTSQGTSTSGSTSSAKEPEKEIELNARIKDVSDEDKEPNNVVVTGEIVEEKKKEDIGSGILNKIKSIISSLRKKLEGSIIEEQISDCDTDMSMVFGCFSDAITNLLAEDKFNPDQIALMEEIINSIFTEGVLIGGEAVIESLEEELKEKLEEFSNTEKIQEELDKERTKKKKAENIIRVLMEMLSAVITYRSWNKGNSGKLADFIENNLPEDIDKKNAYQLISSIGELDRSKVQKAIRDMVKNNSEG